MPVEVRGAVELRKALKKFTPDLAKEIQKEMAAVLKPVTAKARGFIPAEAPLSGWGIASENGRFPVWSSGEAKRGIGYKTTPSKPNKQGFRALARIANMSAAGSIYETAGRKNPNGRPVDPNVALSAQYGVKGYHTTTHKYTKNKTTTAGKHFIESMGPIYDANNQTGAGRRSRKMKGRAIFRAWKEDGGKTNAAVLKAIEISKTKFYAAMGYK